MTSSWFYVAVFALMAVLSSRAPAQPVVSADSVTFKLKAPDARLVELMPWGVQWGPTRLAEKPVAMTQGADGVWTATVKEPPVGVHAYFFRVDGADVGDPAVRPIVGWGTWVSAVEVRPKDMTFDEPRDGVPSGEVRHVWYTSKVTGERRRLVVYTPPGYDKGDGELPVLYLQHGRGEGETAWTDQGRLATILDNLIADGATVPMIVAMENGEAFAKSDPQRRDDRLPRILIEDTIPFVERHYRAIRSPEGRAMGGLSMGSWQTYRTLTQNPGTFTAVAFMAGGFPRDDATAATWTLPPDLKLIHWSVGKDDTMAAGVRKQAEKTPGAVMFESQGGHDWIAWRYALHDLAPRLFRW